MTPATYKCNKKDFLTLRIQFKIPTKVIKNLYWVYGFKDKRV